jgi:hypothetical protein
VPAALATQEELESYLQRSLDTGTAELALAGASGAVRDYCGWVIAPTEAAEWTLDGTGAAILRVPTLHLADVTEVQVDGLVLGVGEYTWTRHGHLYCPLGWPEGFRRIVVEADHGYVDTPDGVRLAVLSMAARSITNPERLDTATVGTVTRRYSQTALETALLHAYRLP